MSQTDVSPHEESKELLADLQSLPFEGAEQTHLAFHEPDVRDTSEPEPGKIDQAQAIPTLENVHEATQYSVRDRKLNEKGLQYEIDQKGKSFKSAISAWRRNVNNATVLMSDTTDVAQLRETRSQVTNNTNKVNDTFGCLCSLDMDDTQRRYYDGLFETFEVECNNFMRKISDVILDIQAETASRGSIRSSRSGKSRHSRASNPSRHSEVAAEAAALATKLKFIDKEAQVRAELEKITTKRKLEMAQAKLGVLEEEPEHSFSFDTKFLIKDEGKDYT